MKHNCYNCKYRGEVPGSAHSSCNVFEDKYCGDIFRFMFERNWQTDNLKMNPHGVKNGWAIWPIDFDPVWVEHCNFYELTNN